jgi:hypothetical protein
MYSWAEEAGAEDAGADEQAGVTSHL